MNACLVNKLIEWWMHACVWMLELWILENIWLLMHVFIWHWYGTNCQGFWSKYKGNYTEIFQNSKTCYFEGNLSYLIYLVNCQFEGASIEPYYHLSISRSVPLAFTKLRETKF